MPFRTLLANTTPKGKAVLAASALGIVAALVIMVKLASAPSYATMLTGLDPAETGKITAALDEKGVSYELKNNGTALAVVKGQIPQARIALAEKGLPGRGQPGFELFDKQKLGASDFQQKVTYQRALEGQIASTIGQVQGVSGAQVSLVLPEDQLFSEEQSPATAAVLLSGSSANLDPSAVRGIASLVASSVKGLKPQNVSITDSSGQLLWPSSDSAAANGGGVNKLTAQSRFNYQRRSTQTDFGVDKTVQRTKVAPGQINRLSVGLVVDKSVPPAQVAQLKNAVSAAAGIDAKRGDVLNVSQVAFAKPATTAPAAGPLGSGGILDYAKYGAAGLGLLAFLFFVMRHLKRRERESLGEPTWLRQIEAPMTLADLEAGRTTRIPAVAAEMPGPSAARVSAENIADSDPERVAQQIRSWMQED